MNDKTTYKLAQWEERSFTFKDGKRSFPTVEAAKASVTAAGKYRISEITRDGRKDFEPFEVTAAQVTKQPKPKKQYSPLASRALSGIPRW
jgi:hypothetical protein